MENIRGKRKTKNIGMTFDVPIFEALENWRWSNKLSRARAVNYILESFFSKLDKNKKSNQKEFNFKEGNN